MVGFAAVPLIGPNIDYWHLVKCVRHIIVQRIKRAEGSKAKRMFSGIKFWIIEEARHRRQVPL